MDPLTFGTDKIGSLCLTTFTMEESFAVRTLPRRVELEAKDELLAATDFTIISLPTTGLTLQHRWMLNLLTSQDLVT